MMMARFVIMFVIIYALKQGLVVIAAENTLPAWVSYPVMQLTKIVTMDWDWSREGDE